MTDGNFPHHCYGVHAEQSDTAAPQDPLLQVYYAHQKEVQQLIDLVMQEAQYTDYKHELQTAHTAADEHTAYTIVKYACKDNVLKPKTVTDIKFAINILDSELVQPIFHHQAPFEHVIKNMVSQYYSAHIDSASGNPEKQQREDSGISPAAIERMIALYVQMDKGTGNAAPIPEHVNRIIDIEKIRDIGFNTAINRLTALLKQAGLAYQYSENLKNAREVLIREYVDTDSTQLPDEHYQIRLRYFNTAQLNEERKAYEVMIRSFETEVEHLWDVLRTQYDKLKAVTHMYDFTSLAKLYKKYIQRNYKIPSGNPIYEDITKIWDEVSFVTPAETEVEKANRTFIHEKTKIKKKLSIIRDRIQKMYQYSYPPERQVIEERLYFLDAEFNRFDSLINPFQVQPGLVLDIDITSIKHKKTTITSMLTVINAFLHEIVKHRTELDTTMQPHTDPARDNASALKTNSDTPATAKPSPDYSQLLELINRTSFAHSVNGPIAPPKPHSRQQHEPDIPHQTGE
ncbi:MAG: hypothetical protein ACTTJ7_04225 [Treponema sp.]